MNKLKVFEAFSGYGSQSLALRNLGIDYEVVAISEINKYAIQAYEAIHGLTNNLGDIEKINVNEVPDHDLFTYSFPCQSVSTAGLKEGLKQNTETKSSLLWECQKIILHKKPKYLLMENVKNLLSCKHLEDFNVWQDWLKNNGYTNTYSVLSSKDFNIPQSRDRVFMISIRDDLNIKYNFPSSKELKTKLFDVLEENVDEKYYKIKPSVQKNLNLLYPYILNCQKDIFVPTQSQVSSGRQDNLVGINITPCLRVNGYTLVLDKTKRVRKLTPKEYWRLMGIPDEIYKKVKDSGLSDTQLYKLAGNSICVPILEDIFKKLFSKT